jgi:hypothetical protein
LLAAAVAVVLARAVAVELVVTVHQFLANFLVAELLRKALCRLYQDKHTL